LNQRNTQRGFTLIELSIALVIIGLIVGGVLVGQSLVAAAGVRATISQIEKYNTAVNTFKAKYEGLPGDIANAGNLGFTSRAGTQGLGDGNGVIEGPAGAYGVNAAYGEPCLFWVDLTWANGQNLNLIEGSFSGGVTGMSASPCGVMTGVVTGAGINDYFPQAKLGGGNYVFVWSGGVGGSPTASNGINYFGIIAISSVASQIWTSQSNPGLTVQQAYSIDKKIDDGLPKTGDVTSAYAAASSFWAPNASTDSSTTCFNSATNTYSMSINNGSGVNCALSFVMQGAAR
jgi:prepilin-type N-terminal cleavage/methylation domain-containing protein